MIHSTNGPLLFVVLFDSESQFSHRTASEIKVHRVQNLGLKPKASTSGVSRVGDIGIDITSGTADEAADRALSSVARKLDKSLSVECTVNALIAEATDMVNLALIYHGKLLDSIIGPAQDSRR
jgi:hypothetical protein